MPYQVLEYPLSSHSLHHLSRLWQCPCFSHRQPTCLPLIHPFYHLLQELWSVKDWLHQATSGAYLWLSLNRLHQVEYKRSKSYSDFSFYLLNNKCQYKKW